VRNFSWFLIALSCALDGKFGGKLQARDKVRIDRLSRGGVVFADRAALVRHKEGVGRQRECGGEPGPRYEVRIDRFSRGGVVLANRAEVEVRYKQDVALDGESLGKESHPRDEVGVNRGARDGIVFSDRTAFVRHKESFALDGEPAGRAQSSD